MIQSIYLRNFESHRNTKLEFGPGINIIEGASDKGKSSIIRGLYWIKDNKPPGPPMISFWNRDSKNNPKKHTFVEIVLSNGSTIRRELSSNLKGYMINDTRLEAIGQTIPEEVTKVLRLSEVNVQYQFDRPFLLDDSPSEVARFFNKTIRLDVIDRVQSKAEKMRKDINRDIGNGELRIKRLNDDIIEFNWIEKVEKDVIELEELNNAIDSYKDKKDSISSLLREQQEYIDTLYKVKKISILSSLTDEIDILNKEIEEEKNRANDIRENLSFILKAENTIKESASLLPFEGVCKEIDTLDEEILKLKKDSDSISILLQEVKEYKEQIANSEKEIKEFEAMLPNICPTCGQRIN